MSAGPLRLVALTFGTEGDSRPMVALCRGLRDAGHEVVLLCEQAGQAYAAECGVPVVAVDLPSGVEADTGEVHGQAVRATLTVTFGAYKPALLIDPARQHAGEVRFTDIGLAPELPGEPDAEALDEADAAALLPLPSAESDKYRRGVVGVAAGSARYPGAAVLAVAYLLPLGYFAWSLFYGKRAGNNPWDATGLEWTTTSPPPPQNFDRQPRVDRGPYDYHAEGQSAGIDPPKVQDAREVR